MTLLKAARMVKTLGLTHDIQRIVGRWHVQEPAVVVSSEIRHRVRRGFFQGADHLGPDAVAWGVQAIEDACATYAVAVHRHNLRTYGRVVGGRI